MIVNNGVENNWKESNCKFEASTELTLRIQVFYIFILSRKATDSQYCKETYYFQNIKTG
jgi:hypothetical protein